MTFFTFSTSQSHVFTTFFKIFFLVVAFGLYNGLVFLPVVLSLIGPASVSNFSSANFNSQVSFVKSDSSVQIATDKGGTAKL